MDTQHSLESAILDWLVCPACNSTLRATSGGRMCSACAVVYLRTTGIWRMVSEADRLRYASFQASYRTVRRLEGWEQTEKAGYHRLPYGEPHDPHAAVWRIRQRSFHRLQKVCGMGA